MAPATQPKPIMKAISAAVGRPIHCLILWKWRYCIQSGREILRQEAATAPDHDCAENDAPGPQAGKDAGVQTGGSRNRHWPAQAAGVAKPGADHELCAAIGTSLGHLGGRGGKCCLRHWFDHARGPPKLLLRFLNNFSHKINKETNPASSKASGQPNAFSTKAFSSQVLATIHQPQPEVIPRNYYSQTRKDGPVTLVHGKTFSECSCANYRTRRGMLTKLLAAGG